MRHRSIPTGAMAILCLLADVCADARPVSAAPARSAPHLRLIAHKGECGDAPENTM